MAQLNATFSSGGRTLSLNKAHFSLFQYLKEEENARHLPIKKVACHIGLQLCGEV